MTRDGLPPTGAVAAEARNFELTESQREIIGVVASGVEEVLHAQEPNQEPSRVGTFVGGGIAVEEVRAFTGFCSGQQNRRIEFGRARRG